MDHRQQFRYDLDTLVKIEQDGQSVLATSLDVGLTGMGCVVTTELAADKPLLISFRLSLKDKPITTWAKLVWSYKTNNKWRIGLEFSELDSGHHRAIADFLSNNWQVAHPA